MRREVCLKNGRKVERMAVSDKGVIDFAQRYIIDNVEKLLIELACDQSLTEQEIRDQSQVICQLVMSKEAKQYLLERIHFRQDEYFDKRVYQPIIDCLN